MGYSDSPAQSIQWQSGVAGEAVKNCGLLIFLTCAIFTVAYHAQHESDNAEKDPEDDGEGEPCVSQGQDVVSKVRGVVDLEDCALGRGKVLDLDVTVETVAK